VSAYLLPEAALRSLAMAAIVLAALRLLRIDQVRARRTAWLLALAGALAMPLLVGAHIGPRLLPDITFSASHLPELPMPAHYAGSAAPWAATAAPNARNATNATIVQAAGSQNARLASYAVSICAAGYCIVAAVLSLRLGAGVGFALRLRNQAQHLNLPFDPRLDVRVSSRIGTPVTIASTVLLPSSYPSWDASTLRIVLAHERAHVLQRDFWVHALTGLHCAIFWFNPFSWWLQRQLAELGEALSDHSAVEQAESRASYAEVLLAFATAVRRPFAGVAMASSSNLSPRIERLLSDHGFERSFADKQRLPFIAAGVVVLAMAASTSMARVDAAPNAAQAPKPASLPADSSAASSAASGTDSGPATGTENGDDGRHEDSAVAKRDEGVLVIRSGQSKIAIDSGNRLPSQAGDYIYFQHNGKPYLIQDPKILSRAQSLLAPMQDLGRQEKDLGRQRALLGSQQRELIAQQRLIKIDTPDFRREVAELENVAKQMKLAELSQIDEKALAQLQSHLAEIQSRVDSIQTDLARQEGSFGEKEGNLGELEGKLGEQLARLAEQRQKMLESVRRELKPLIEQAIRDGKATQLPNE
jgi:beta-lactamase regulating signal transducer with metallopeptidase domain